MKFAYIIIVCPPLVIFYMTFFISSSLFLYSNFVDMDWFTMYFFKSDYFLIYQLDKLSFSDNYKWFRLDSLIILSVNNFGIPLWYQFSILTRNYFLQPTNTNSFYKLNFLMDMLGSQLRKAQYFQWVKGMILTL